MISFDLECAAGHRFEGIFRDYPSFEDQMDRGLVSCPVCGSGEVKRIFTGCSIQSKSQRQATLAKQAQNVFDFLRMAEAYVKENFDNVGRDFPDRARAIYYGIEEPRNIYGQSSPEEIKELADEGIGVLPLPNLDTLEN